jgi:hypothetical protein
VAFALRIKAEVGTDDYSSAHVLLEESLTLYRELGDKWGMAGVLNDLGLVKE